MPPPHLTHLNGSRRLRLWELSPAAHCPVVGVCIPMSSLRKLLGSATADADYEVHAASIHECNARSPASEKLQRTLDVRYAQELRETAPLRTAADLGRWWHDLKESPRVQGALWATLTHAKCDLPLQKRILTDIHMLQHQWGAARRAELALLDATKARCDALAKEIDETRERLTRSTHDLHARCEQQQGEIMTLRAALIGRDTVIADLRASLARQARFVQADAPARRFAPLRRAAGAPEPPPRPARPAAPAPAPARVVPIVPTAAPAPPKAPVTLDDMTILCVGGRSHSVCEYRDAVERRGGRFLHHDGGEKHGRAKLVAGLCAADLVVCQAGCVSHRAYWHVKAHCKRTGKKCVFLDNPSVSSLERGLEVAVS